MVHFIQQAKLIQQVRLMFETVLIVLNATCRPLLDYIRINSLFTSEVKLADKEYQI